MMASGWIACPVIFYSGNENGAAVVCIECNQGRVECILCLRCNEETESIRNSSREASRKVRDSDFLVTCFCRGQL